MSTQRKTRPAPPGRTSHSKHAANSATIPAVSVTGVDQSTGRLLALAARATLAAEGVRDGRLDIAVVDADTMCAQHARWMNDPTVTDVLTFDLRPEAGPPPPRAHPGGARRGKRRPTAHRRNAAVSSAAASVDGQIIVCADVARDRAARRDADWRGELVLYVVHGCLHLCGYDDRAAADFRRMHAREDDIMTTLGFGPIYQDGESSSARPEPRPIDGRRRPSRQRLSVSVASNRPTQSRAAQGKIRRTTPRAIRRNASRSG